MKDAACEWPLQASPLTAADADADVSAGSIQPSASGMKDGHQGENSVQTEHRIPTFCHV